jgi:hypothetical protein
MLSIGRKNFSYSKFTAEIQDFIFAVKRPIFNQLEKPYLRFVCPTIKIYMAAQID